MSTPLAQRPTRLKIQTTGKTDYEQPVLTEYITTHTYPPTHTHHTVTHTHTHTPHTHTQHNTTHTHTPTPTPYAHTPHTQTSK
jgi:hypothetical protein